MPQSKSTKKFEKKHLKDVLKKRKDVAKIKQKKQIKERRKARKMEDGQREEMDNEENVVNTAATEDNLKNMSVDNFFQSDFGIATDSALQACSSSKKRKRHTPSEATEKREESVEEEERPEADFGDEFEQHKSQLAKLSEIDPDFHKFLQENDAELLDFDEDAALGEIDALSDSEDEGQLKKNLKKSKGDTGDVDGDEATSESNDVSLAQIQRWETSLLEKQSLRSMRELSLAFRAAVNSKDDSQTRYKYSISDPNVYNKILISTLTYIPSALKQQIPIQESKGGKIRIQTDSKKFKTLSNLIKSHALSIIRLAKDLSDASTLRLTLSSLQELLPYTLSFKKIVKEIYNTIVDVWSDSSNHDATRIAAFLVLRKLVVIGDPGIREGALKAVYQGLIKGSRNCTVHTLQGINLMKNSAAELWGSDATVGYTTGFTFIRQLAIHLRSSITNKTKDSYKAVYNWQYVHSLDFWSRVLSVHCESLKEAETGKGSPLRPLIYPVVQVTLGAIRLIPTSQYFPLRFQLVRSLLRISLASSTYIPLAAILLEVLNSAEMRKSPKPSTVKSLDFSVSIRASKSFLRTRIYQDGVGEQVTELLAEFFVLHTKSIAFPELSLPVIVMLKRWLKEVSKKGDGNKNMKLNTMTSLLIRKIEANCRYIEEHRAKVEFAPNNRTAAENFLKDIEWEKTPLGAYVAGQRKAKEEKAKLVEVGRLAEQTKLNEEHGQLAREPNRDEDGAFSSEGDVAAESSEGSS